MIEKEELEKKLKHIQDEINKNEKRQEEYRIQIEGFKKELKELEDKKMSSDPKIKTIPTQITNINNIIVGLEKRKNILQNQLNALRPPEPFKRPDAARVAEKPHHLNDDLAEINRQALSKNLDSVREEHIQNLTKQIELLNKSKTELQNVKAPVSGTTLSKDEIDKYDTAQAKIRKIDDKIKVAEAKIEETQKPEQTYTRAGFSSHEQVEKTQPTTEELYKELLDAKRKLTEEQQNLNELTKENSMSGKPEKGKDFENLTKEMKDLYLEQKKKAELELNSLEEGIKKLEKEISDKKLATMDQQIDLKKENDSKNKEKKLLEESQTQEGLIQTEITEMTSQKLSLKKKIKELDKEIQKLDEQIEQEADWVSAVQQYYVSDDLDKSNQSLWGVLKGLSNEEFKEFQKFCQTHKFNDKVKAPKILGNNLLEHFMLEVAKLKDNDQITEKLEQINSWIKDNKYPIDLNKYQIACTKALNENSDLLKNPTFLNNLRIHYFSDRDTVFTDTSVLSENTKINRIELKNLDDKIFDISKALIAKMNFDSYQTDDQGQVSFPESTPEHQLITMIELFPSTYQQIKDQISEELLKKIPDNNTKKSFIGFLRILNEKPTLTISTNYNSSGIRSAMQGDVNYKMPLETDIEIHLATANNFQEVARVLSDEKLSDKFKEKYQSGLSIALTKSLIAMNEVSTTGLKTWGLTQDDIKAISTIISHIPKKDLNKEVKISTGGTPEKIQKIRLAEILTSIAGDQRRGFLYTKGNKVSTPGTEEKKAAALEWQKVLDSASKQGAKLSMRAYGITGNIKATDMLKAIGIASDIKLAPQDTAVSELEKLVEYGKISAVKGAVKRIQRVFNKKGSSKGI